MRSFITLILVLVTLSAFGQSRKGHFYLSGNTSLSAEGAFPEAVPNFGFNQFTGNDEEDAVTWRAQSSRIGYFFTNRLLLGTDLYVGTKTKHGRDESNYFLNPFVRYYVTDRPGGKVNFFAQLSLLTIGDYGSGRISETNFYLGVGAEVRLTDDVAACALLRYNAYASGLNFTELELSISTFLSGGLGKPAGPALVKGGVMIDPSIGGIQLGHRGRDETLNLIADLNLSGGYLVHDRWMVEAALAVNTDQYKSAGVFDRSFENNITQLEASAMIGARYFPTFASRLRPYLLGRSFFNLSEQTSTQPFGGNDITSTNRLNTLHLQAGGGALLPLSNNVVLEGEVLYAAPISGEALQEVWGRVGLKVFLPQ